MNNENETTFNRMPSGNKEFFHKVENSDSTDLMTKFKTEIISDTKDIETVIIASHKQLKEEFDQRTQQYEKRLEDLTIKLNELSSFTSVDRIKLEKISELQTFQKKANDQLISHEIKLSNLQKDLNSACYKYDKIYLDNLVVPGTIGDYCKFKNMKDYIEKNVTNVQNLTNFKEKHTLELKSYKDKLDGMIKTMGMQLENTDRNARTYTNKIVQEYENNLKSELSEVSNKIYDLKMDNNKYAVQLQKSSNELMIEYERIMNIKAEINKDLEEAVLNMKDSHKVTVNDFDIVKGEFDRIKARFNDIAEFIKVIFNIYLIFYY
jgi:hypothetical protein